MIAQPQDYQKMTPEEYLEWEAKQEFRHEYIDGKILPMTRETIPYNDIVLNLCSTLYPSVHQKSCRINLLEVKVKDGKNSRYFYQNNMGLKPRLLRRNIFGELLKSPLQK
ncbi:MAG: hypothetical protein F6K15_07330 [Okeania sp. SIO2B3]|nr:hypothetical protein [Okeania sp. SIO2B3]